MPVSRLYGAIQRFRGQVERQEQYAANQMIRTYGLVHRTVTAELDRISQRVLDAQAAGTRISRDWLYRQTRLQSLLQMIQNEIDGFGSFASSQIADRQRAAVLLSRVHSERLIILALGPTPDLFEPPASFIRFSPRAVEEFVGRTSAGSPVRSLFRSITTEALSVVQTSFVSGIVQGLNPTKVAKQFSQEFQVPLKRSLTIARTEIIGTYRESNLQHFRENPEIVKGWRWRAARNLRTCAMCVSGETLVSGPTPKKVFSRYYTGDILLIQTAGGKQLSVTPNHPILTNRGWVKANLLRKGDNVISSSRGKDITLNPSYVDDYQIPARIEEVAKTCGMILTEMECTSPDFHGDGKGSQVYTVGATSLLGGSYKSQISKHHSESEFIGRNPGIESDFGSGLPPLCNLAACLPGSAYGMDGLYKSRFLLRQRYSSTPNNQCLFNTPTGNTGEIERRDDCLPAYAKSFRESKDGYTGLIEDCDLIIRQSEFCMASSRDFCSRNSIPLSPTSKQITCSEYTNQSLGTDTESGTELLCRLAGQVSLDCILSISIRRFEGHVYNLETEEGWYWANGIVSHNCLAMDGREFPPEIPFGSHCNCRCSPEPVTHTWQELGFDLPERRRFLYTRAEANWFPKLSPEEQARILGKAKLRMYEEGQLTLSDLIGYKHDKTWGPSRWERSLKQVREGRFAPPKSALGTVRLGGSLTIAGGAPDVPTPSAKSILAKQTSRLVGADVQRYSEEHCEPILAKGLRREGAHASSLGDNEPADVIRTREGKIEDGIELKTMTDNKNDKITVKRSAAERKAAWMKENRADFHTVVFNDEKVFNAKGQGKHGSDDDREIYYRRGFGSFRVKNMYKAKNMEELHQLLDMKVVDLPMNAKPLAGYAGYK